MSAITVTIIKSGRTDSYGMPLIVGQSYSLEPNLADSLYQSGYASVVDPVVFDDDAFSHGRVVATCMRFPGFRTSLLASLAASSTAARTANVVTVSATGHGITTGATYAGFRFYYPGSTSLTAGWYDSILTIPDANTITFAASGPDFASESINSGAAWTTVTDAFSMTIPGGTLKDESKLSVSVLRSGDTSSVSKGISVTFGGTQISAVNATTSPHGDVRIGFRQVGSAKQFGVSSAYDGATAGTLLAATKDATVDQTLALRCTAAAASAFVCFLGAFVEITQ